MQCQIQDTKHYLLVIRDYPDYRFHYLQYARQEVLFLPFSIDNPHDALYVYNSNANGFCYIRNVHANAFTWNAIYRHPPEKEDDDLLDGDLPPCSLSLHEEISSRGGLNQRHGSRVWTHTALYQEMIREWFMSLANLFVATEADGFVGTLTSNWCTMIAKLARTRGDGGAEYFSVDRGSFYTSCF